MACVVRRVDRPTGQVHSVEHVCSNGLCCGKPRNVAVDCGLLPLDGSGSVLKAKGECGCARRCTTVVDLQSVDANALSTVECAGEVSWMAKH